MKIEVTKEDISYGLPYSPFFCPIAYAIKRKFPFKKIIVTYKHIWIGDICYVTPIRVQIFMKFFDNEHSVEPFEFILEDEVRE